MTALVALKSTDKVVPCDDAAKAPAAPGSVVRFCAACAASIWIAPTALRHFEGGALCVCWPCGIEAFERALGEVTAREALS